MFLAILFIAFGLSLLILIHEAGHFFAAKAFGMKVEEFGFGFPPRAWSTTIGETIYSVNWLPIGGFVRLMGEVETTGAPMLVEDEVGVPTESRQDFRHQAISKRAAVVAAGVGMNFFLGWLLLSALFLVGIPPAVVITAVNPGSPAEAAGVLPGDRILGVESVDAFVGAVGTAAGKEFSFEIARGGVTLTTTLVPRADPKPGEGRIGVELVEAGTAPMPFWRAAGHGFVQSLVIVKLVFFAILSLLGGILMGAPDFSAVTGPIGIFTAASGASSLGLLYLVQLIALISLNLAALNILPFPALDGGGLALLVLEKLRGIPLSLRTERLITSAGFAALLLLMAAITVKDILSL
ncbi:MAG: Membrane-associated zinc metalloprotease [Parcubacteria group bacterium GW2011_GWA1_60_11]|nr:MAG: Membrane-associated zinc metalloprotease [Parcubacteria group bacterium GW2011_GWA1_60_11]